MEDFDLPSLLGRLCGATEALVLAWSLLVAATAVMVIVSGARSAASVGGPCARPSPLRRRPVPASMGEGREA